MPPSNVAPKVAMIMILMSVLMSTTIMVEITTTLASLSVIKTQCPKKDDHRQKQVRRQQYPRESPVLGTSGLRELA